MTPYIFLAGALAAIFVVLIFMLIRQWATFIVQNWSRELTRETLARLHETHLKLDRIMNFLDRLQRDTTAMSSMLRNLRSAASESQTAVEAGGSKGSSPASL